MASQAKTEKPAGTMSNDQAREEAAYTLGVQYGRENPTLRFNMLGSSAEQQAKKQRIVRTSEACDPGKKRMPKVRAIQQLVQIWRELHKRYGAQRR